MKNKNSYELARSNLLLVIIFTVINVLLTIFEADIMFLFSAIIPYFYTLVGYYSGDVLYYIIPALVILAYLGCWYFSKKHLIGLIAACVLFVIDSIFMLWIYGTSWDVSVIIDVIFHAWVLFYLIGGILYAKDKKEIFDMTTDFEKKEEFDESLENSKYLRYAEETKARIFLEEEVLGKHVVFRRVKTVNELVINGKVYDEYEALIEKPHSLKARIEGHTIEAGCNVKSQMYIALDGEIIKKKFRLI